MAHISKYLSFVTFLDVKKSSLKLHDFTLTREVDKNKLENNITCFRTKLLPAAIHS